MTIDSSENVMVGTTNNNPTSSSVNVAGQSFSATGGVRSTVDQNPSGTFNRKTDDGQIVLFRKDGTTIGSIGVTSSDQLFLTRATGSQGIKLKNSALMPSNADGSDSDNDQDLGSSSVRWKDLYLSGGAFIGGTGSANQLDDYEEGSWTPVLEGSGTTSGVAYSRRQGRYTKVGDKVFVNFHIVLSSEGTIGSTAKISGLPFSGNGEPLYQVCHIMSGNMALDKDQLLTGMQFASNAFIYLMIQESDLALSQVTGNGSFKDNSEMVGMCTYYTNS